MTTNKLAQVIAKHRRHVELSPGVGEDLQRYALAVLDDVSADLSALASAPAGEAVDYTDIANRVQEITGRSIYPSTVEAVLKVAGFTHPTPAADASEGEAIASDELANWLHEKLLGFSRKIYGEPWVKEDLRMAFKCLRPIFARPAPADGGDAPWYLDDDGNEARGHAFEFMGDAHVVPVRIAQAEIDRLSEKLRRLATSAQPGDADDLAALLEARARSHGG